MMTIICNSLFCKFSFSDVSATLQSRKSSSSNESDAVHQRLSDDRTVDTKQIQGNSYITNTGSEGESKNGFTLKDSLTVHKNLLTIFSRQYFVLYSEENLALTMYSIKINPSTGLFGIIQRVVIISAAIEQRRLP